MKRIVGIVIFTVALDCSAQIKLSEVMFDPAGAENSEEFIELYNSSQTSSFDLSTILIGDQAAQEPLDLQGIAVFLAPNQYAVIFDSDYDTAIGIYTSMIPQAALVLKVNDKTLGSAGLSNSSTETILVLNMEGDTLDSYQYSLDNEPGFSDERINFEKSNTPENWANSRSIHGTPGRENSVMEKLYDFELSVSLSTQENEPPRALNNAFVDVTLINKSRNAVENVEISIIISDTLLLEPQYITQFLPDSAMQLVFNWTPEISGEVQIVAHVLSQEIEFNKNYDFWIELPSNSLVINEIMFSPNNGEPEWIEVYNESKISVILNDLRLRDASGRQALVDYSNDIFLTPNAFAVFSSDSTMRMLYSLDHGIKVLQLYGFPSLNNTNETIALLGKSGVLLDSVAITHSAKSGISLERVSATERSTSEVNWMYSLANAGATPGKSNSVSPVEFDLAIDTSNIHLPVPLPERNKEFSMTFPVKNIGKKTAVVTGWELYDPNDDYVFASSVLPVTLEVGEILPLTLSHICTKSGKNSFVFEISAQDDNRVTNNRYAFSVSASFLYGDLIVNEIMINPFVDAPEWVELYNVSDQRIYMQEWTISDGSTLGVINTEQNEPFIDPNEYVILSQSTFQMPIDSKIILPSNWPTLNNDGDIIYILDQNDCLIDSVHYTSRQVGERGISLENMNFNVKDSGMLNWDFCVSPEGSTPGIKNSLYIEKMPISAQLSVTPDPFSPDGDGIDDHVLIQYELPLQTSNVDLIIFDLRGRKVRHLLRNASSAAERAVFWDGRDDEGRLLDIGIYIVYVQSLNASRGMLQTLKKAVVLAKKL
ncbi:lamin tail domain-containing protein [candidate division KSB1 bacterium]|nr:lamin tail domain-containing protein [candidate division KSB1 bacterium]